MKEQQVFILRRWRDDATQAWRLSLKNIETKEIRYFPSEAALAKHLLNTPEEALVEVIPEECTR